MFNGRPADGAAAAGAAPRSTADDPSLPTVTSVRRAQLTADERAKAVHMRTASVMLSQLRCGG